MLLQLVTFRLLTPCFGLLLWGRLVLVCFSPSLLSPPWKQTSVNLILGLCLSLKSLLESAGLSSLLGSSAHVILISQVQPGSERKAFIRSYQGWALFLCFRLSGKACPSQCTVFWGLIGPTVVQLVGYIQQPLLATDKDWLLQEMPVFDGLRARVNISRQHQQTDSLRDVCSCFWQEHSLPLFTDCAEMLDCM